MPKINRSKTSYRKLPDGLKTSSIPDAKISVSITVTVPKGMESRAEKFIGNAQDVISDGFKDFIKKETKRYLKDSKEGE